MTEEEWEQVLQSMNEYAKKFCEDKIQEIKYNVVKEIIQRETKK